MKSRLCFMLCCMCLVFSSPIFAAVDKAVRLGQYGQGYACAQDRGFQMHYFLCFIQGRLAEVVGDVAKVLDGGSLAF